MNEKTDRYPPQIRFIIGNEVCERFSFYGMRNILTIFLIQYLLASEIPDPATRQGAAKEVFHTFVMGVYFFPLLGGWLSDRFFGKYRTILWVSVLYCVGQFSLALSSGWKPGFYTGLVLIALGSGGIKPCVSSFVGDQFDQTNKQKAKIVYDAFYWSINFGSFSASLLIPRILRGWGAAWAFGIPGILMLVATAIFWAGRRRYVRVPSAPPDPHGFLPVALSALRSRGRTGPGLVVAGAGVVLALVPSDTWPSPATATRPPRQTATMVVPRGSVISAFSLPRDGFRRRQGGAPSRRPPPGGSR